MGPSKYSSSITPISQVLLDLPPSCVEFVPWHEEVNPSNDLFVVGTYNLVKDDVHEKIAGPQTRNGSLVLFRLNDGNLDILDSVQTQSAILDIHFLPGALTFGASDSTGNISIFKLVKTPASNKVGIKEVIRHQIFPDAEDNDTLILSFAWYPYTEFPPPPAMVMTLNTGEIHVIRFKSWGFDSYLTEHGPLISHSQKAECCAWSPYSTGPGDATYIYTGGDDVRESTLRISCLPHLDSTKEYDFEAELQLPHRKFRPHDSGLTAILPLRGPDFSHSNPLLLTGGYDGYVRVYAPYGDASSSRPQTHTEVEIGGGVWKLKLINQDVTSTNRPSKYRVLASCMHAGSRVLDVIYSDGRWTINVIGSVGHDLNYACDFQPLTPDFQNNAIFPNEFNLKRVCLSTSFYDRLLCAWEFDPLRGDISK